MEQYISKSALLAEIERLVNNYDKALDYEAALEDVRDFIDSLEVKESAEIQHVNETCKENGNSLTQETVSEVWHDAQTEQPQAKEKILATNEYGDCEVDFAINMALYWPKVIKWAYIKDLLNLSNVQRTVKNWEEPVSEDLEEAADNALESISDQYDIISVGSCLEMFRLGAEWQKNHLWKPADGDDLPEYEREVVVFTQNFPNDAGMMMVAIGHRPTPEGYDGKSLTTGEVEHYIPETYGKGGWNIPDVKFWLDVELPKEIEL